jgi:hypothetical protein
VGRGAAIGDGDFGIVSEWMLDHDVLQTWERLFVVLYQRMGGAYGSEDLISVILCKMLKITF